MCKISFGNPSSILVLVTAAAWLAIVKLLFFINRFKAVVVISEDVVVFAEAIFVGDDVVSVAERAAGNFLTQQLLIQNAKWIRSLSQKHRNSYLYHSLRHLFIKLNLLSTTPTIIIIIYSKYVLFVLVNWFFGIVIVVLIFVFLFFGLIFFIWWNWFYQFLFWQLQKFNTLTLWVISVIKPLFTGNPFDSLLFWSTNFTVKEVIVMSHLYNAKCAWACYLFEH